MLDLHKTYDSLHRDRTLEDLRSYGVGPTDIRLVMNYWESQMTVVRQGIPLERVNTFKYLGWQVGSIGEDWPALYRNLNKTWGQWGSVSQVLLHEGHAKRTSGMFFKKGERIHAHALVSARGSLE
jgi:hypothetical protein